jgi:transposase-like protein
MATLAELRNRGLEDVCIVACDGLKGLPDAIAEIWPLATVQQCVVHLVRASLRYASKAHWSQITKALRARLHRAHHRGRRGMTALASAAGANSARLGNSRGLAEPRCMGNTIN